VLVKSAAQGTSDLSTAISNAPLAPDIRKALLAKLNAALKAIADGKSKGACSALNDFINQVMAQGERQSPWMLPTPGSIPRASSRLRSAAELPGCVPSRLTAT